jgi:hypothetical protein
VSLLQGYHPLPYHYNSVHSLNVGVFFTFGSPDTAQLAWWALLGCATATLSSLVTTTRATRAATISTLGLGSQGLCQHSLDACSFFNTTVNSKIPGKSLLFINKYYIRIITLFSLLAILGPIIILFIFIPPSPTFT